MPGQASSDIVVLISYGIGHELPKAAFTICQRRTAGVDIYYNIFVLEIFMRAMP
ncbi:MAG: hypothetical protein PF501_09380 [Salinisphaera sp.]|jgi:uncharacterized membrane protein YdfJ with MMPL/SSD domain|nr:hypothetical protein [Salinisphaera sp.]